MLALPSQDGMHTFAKTVDYKHTSLIQFVVAYSWFLNAATELVFLFDIFISRSEFFLKLETSFSAWEQAGQTKIEPRPAKTN